LLISAKVPNRHNMKKLFFILILISACSISFSQVSKNIENAKAVITGFSEGKMNVVASYFDETMKTALPEEKLKVVWKDLNSQCGDYQKFSKITTEKTDNYEIVYVLCQFKNMELRMKTVFNKQNQISGLFFVP